MSTKEQMLEAIQKEMSDKTLSFGCKTIHGIILKEEYNEDIGGLGIELIGGACWSSKWFDENPQDIIGHPVMIGDVLDWAEQNAKKEKRYFRDTISGFIIENWNEFRKPITEQSEECIEYVYSLIQSGK